MTAMRKFLILATSIAGYACVSVGAEEQKPQVKPKPVTVITKFEDGRPVEARIMVRRFDKADEEVKPTIGSSASGTVVVLLAECDGNVGLNATARSLNVTRKKKDWLPCNEQQVTFNDFVAEPFATALANPSLTMPGTWVAVLGPEAVASKPGLPNEVATAFANKEYGKISIIGTELNVGLRRAGKIDEADYFYALAQEAAALGAAEAIGSAGIGSAATDFVAITGRNELTPDARLIIEKFQMKKLGLPKDYANLGKVDWQTMKSLPGGVDVFAPDFQVSKEAYATIGRDALIKSFTKPDA